MIVPKENKKKKVDALFVNFFWLNDQFGGWGEEYLNPSSGAKTPFPTEPRSHDFGMSFQTCTKFLHKIDSSYKTNVEVQLTMH